MSPPLKLLVVEDTEDDALLVVRQLRDGGYDVKWERVETAEALRAALDRQLWDVVVCDFHLPRFDGLAAISLIRSLGLDLPTIIVSGTIGEDLAVSTLKAGAHDYLMKGKLARLASVVKREMGEAAGRRDRKQMAAALVASELRYRRLFESAKDGILILDAETGMVVDVNPFLIEKLGFTREQFLEKEIWNLGFFKDIVANEASFVELQRNEFIRYDDKPLRTTDGRRIDVEFVSNVYLVDGHKVIQCNIRDISERRHTEDALRREQALFTELANTIPDHIFFKDRQSRFIRINRAAALGFGLGDAADAIGKTDFDIFSEDQARKYQSDEQRIMETGEPMIGVEEKGTWPDGHVTWSSSTKMSLRDAQGRITGLVGINRDITEQKNAKEALRRSEAEFRAAFENAPIGIALVDPDGRPIRCNLVLQKLLGYSESELRRMAFPEFTHPDDVQADLALYRELLEGKRESYQLEKRFVRKGGEVINVRLSVSTSLVRGPTRKEQYAIAMVEDVTEKKRMEEQILRAQRMESIGLLAGGIAHDLNNILAPMLMGASLLRTTLTEPRDQGIVTIIEKGAERGAAIIRQLMKFSRGFEGVTSDIQIRQVISEMLEIIRETFPRNIEVTSTAPENLWVVKGNATQIHQVLMNLCVNARDAMRDGGRLSITAVNTTLSEESASLYPMAKPGRYVLMTVADTGQGVPKEIIDRIYEPFFTTKEMGQGTGLGLSTSLGIVTNHGGFMALDSKPSKGSQFKVYLPVTDELQATIVKTPAAVPLGNSELILLVDDEAPVRDAIKHVLEARRYRVVTAKDGVEALQKFVRYRDAVKLVLTDMMMPTMDGTQLIRALRILEPKAKVVAMSGLDKAFPREELDTLGVLELLAKPCDANRLLRTVHRALIAP
jgi:PAS domain S-box-containing protein